MLKFYTLAAVLTLAGCASLDKGLPEGYKGPTAYLEDTGESEGSSKAKFFVIVEQDGRQIRNSIHETRVASSGQGFALSPRFTGREIPAKAGLVKLLGTHQTAAPIHEIASRTAGTFYRVEGVVKFDPEQGGLYAVRGELEKAKSCVWIENLKTKQFATEKVCTP